uniref:Nitrate transporter n=1 Tax=Solanum tuberosum TaxID=4113 RepID=M1B9M9_SOLTU
MGIETQVEEKPRKGGLRTMPFIIVNEAFERVASYGLQFNMLIYLMTYYNMSAATGTTILGLWGALSSGLALVGAIIADSYWGRFRAVAFGSISTLIVRNDYSMAHSNDSPTQVFTRALISNMFVMDQHYYNLTVLFSSFGFMSVGAGFVRPCSIIFGADQLENKTNPENQRILESYFNWYYVSTGISTILAVTLIVYIQDSYGWKVGFGVPAILMFLSVLMFQIGSPLYIKVKAKTKQNLVIGLFQTVVAAFRKRNNTRLSFSDCDEYYRWPLESEVFTPSKDLRFLNRACMIEDPERDLNPDGSASNPWNLSSLEQVESLKAIIRVLPMWSTGFIIFVDMNDCDARILIYMISYFAGFLREVLRNESKGNKDDKAMHKEQPSALPQPTWCDGGAGRQP